MIRWGSREPVEPGTLRTALALVVVAVAFVVLLSLAACGDALRWDGEGVVTDLRYDDPDDWTTPGQCLLRDDDTGVCLLSDDIEHHDDAHWFVQVTERSGRDHLIEVTETMHDRCRLGARWSNGRCPG